MNVLRNVLAGFAGVVSMLLVVMAGDGLTGVVYPPTPASTAAEERYSTAMRSGNATDLHAAREDMRAQLATWPTGANLLLISGWVLAAFVGGGVAAFLSPARACTLGLFIGALDALGVVANSYFLPHPVWMPVAGVVGALVCGLAAGVLVAVQHAKQKAGGHGAAA